MTLAQLKGILKNMKSSDRKILGDLSTLSEHKHKNNLTTKESGFKRIFKEIRRDLDVKSKKWIIENAIFDASERTGLDPDLIRTVIKADNEWHIEALAERSDPESNAHFLSQKDLELNLMRFKYSVSTKWGVSDFYDPLQNIITGSLHLAEQLRNFNGDLELALAAYNTDPELVMKYGDIPPFVEVESYVSQAIDYYEILKQQANSKSGRIRL